jgi:hypothetical protein
MYGVKIGSNRVCECTPASSELHIVVNLRLCTPLNILFRRISKEILVIDCPMAGNATWIPWIQLPKSHASKSYVHQRLLSPRVTEQSIPSPPPGPLSSLDAVNEALRSHMIQNGYHLGVKRRKGPDGDPRLFYLECSRAGRPPMATQRVRKTSSQACGCEMRAKARRIQEEHEIWVIESVGTHTRALTSFSILQPQKDNVSGHRCPR